MKEKDADESYSDSDAIHMKDPVHDEANTPTDTNNNRLNAIDKRQANKSSMRKNMSHNAIAYNQSAPMPRNFSESFQRQGRRPTIFDSMDAESNESDSQINLLNLSVCSSADINSDEATAAVVPVADLSRAKNDSQMNEAEKKEFSSLNKLRDSAKQTRHVDFDVTGDRVNQQRTGSTRSGSRSTLKHFNIKSISLMNQNVDENEEYEQATNKESSKLLNHREDKLIFVQRSISQIDSGSNSEQSNPTSSTINSVETNDSGIKDERPMLRGQDNSKEEVYRSAVKSKKLEKKPKTNKKSSNPIKLVKNDHSSIKPREVFIELQQLVESGNGQPGDDSPGAGIQYEWKEVSRWVKYEQTVNSETSVWGKPFVGALVYQSLLYLKTGLQYGTVILDSDETSYEAVIDEMVEDFINSGHMYKESKEKVKQTLLLGQHTRVIRPHSMSRKKSSISLAFSTRRQSTYADLLSSGKVARKNSSAVQINELAASRQINDHKLLSVSDADLESGPADRESPNELNNSNSVRFFTPEESHTSSNHHFKRRRSTIALIKGSVYGSMRPGSVKNASRDLNLGMSQDAEACAVMIGVVDFLDRPVMGFIRLHKSQMIDDMVEVQMKVRFVFVLLGPKNDNIDYLEIGRCIGTLMTNKDFHETAYKATDRRDLINSIATFTNKSLCLVLPVGNFDEDLLTPIVEWMQDTMKKKTSNTSSLSDIQIYDKSGQEVAKMSHKQMASPSAKPQEAHEDLEIDPFQQTRRPFGCLANEIKHRYSCYWSDLADGLNLHCLVAFVFIFTVCLAPALSFGGILATKTERAFGVSEMLMATSLNGVIAGLLSGQPLMIYGATGPFLVFEEMLFYFCRMLCIEHLAIRVWVALWVLVFSLAILALEGVYIIKYVTRFTEEIFAMLIACVFLFDAVKIIILIFTQDPIYTSEWYCEEKNKSYLALDYNENSTSENVCRMYTSSHASIKPPPVPNKALISFCLLVGTCGLALILKKLRRSVFFGSYIRRTLSDVGILVSIVLMVLFNRLIEGSTFVRTDKLEIPVDFYTPTDLARKGWLVSPFGGNFNTSHSKELEPQYWFFAIFPAFLIFIVLFFEVEVIGLILHTKHRNLKKGFGFNLDLLIASLMMTLNSFFGLPWMCAAPVRTLAHWASLTVYSSNYVPGEKPKLIEVKEQRVTNIMVHVAIGLCLLAKEALKTIPVSVLFGIFLYFGIVSLSGTQLYERIRLFFIPSKYCPNIVYARGVRPSKRNLFTLIQVLAVIFLIIVKSKNQISFTFPLFLVMLVPLRIYVLPKLFSNRELEQLDHSKEQESFGEMDLDFYEITHLPI